MSKQEFKLHGTNVSAVVIGNSDEQTINIAFDVSDTAHDGNTIDINKYNNAVTYQKTITGVLQQISTHIDIQKSESLDNHQVSLDINCPRTQDYNAAMGILREMILRDIRNTNKGPQNSTEKAGEQFVEPPEDILNLTPNTRSNTHETQRLKERLKTAKNESEKRRTLKTWKLEDTLDDVNAHVFIADKSNLTGNMDDREQNVIVISLTSGPATKDSRAAIYKNTHEIEKRLKARGISLNKADILLDRNDTGKEDQGVIFVNAGPNAPDILQQVHEVLSGMQFDADIIGNKLGSRRGKNNDRNKGVTTISVINPPVDPLIATLTSNIRAAEDAGLIDINGTTDELNGWVQSMVTEIRSQQEPPRRSSGGR